MFRWSRDQQGLYAGVDPGEEREKGNFGRISLDCANFQGSHRRRKSAFSAKLIENFTLIQCFRSGSKNKYKFGSNIGKIP